MKNAVWGKSTSPRKIFFIFIAADLTQIVLFLRSNRSIVFPYLKKFLHITQCCGNEDEILSHRFHHQLTYTSVMYYIPYYVCKCWLHILKFAMKNFAFRLRHFQFSFVPIKRENFFISVVNNCLSELRLLSEASIFIYDKRFRIFIFK